MKADSEQRWTGRLNGARERVAGAFGVTREAREANVNAMLSGHRRDAATYWLQLLVAMGIATLGLVLDSAAVVIGAMLVSPLMGPLVELGMGLAIGSAILISRALFRTTASVVGVVLGAAALTLLLPFHELTPEIASRTSPTVLDLFVAALCAVMAAVTTVRASSSSASTAAGAAIAIALVPPLSVVGWGLGTGRLDVMRGAALLFTANLCAILFLTVLLFAIFGFDQVQVQTLEEQASDPSRLSDRFAARVRRLLGSRYGIFLRWLAPLVFFVLVFVPLRRALEEVVWQVGVRRDVQRLVDTLAPPDESVHSTIDVASHRVTVRLVVLGDASRAERIDRELRAGLAKVTDVTPTIDVVAVPDLAVLEKFAAAHLAQAPAVPPPPTFPDLDWPRRLVRDYLAAAWPKSAAGPLLSWEVRLGESPPARVEVVHFGAALGTPGAALLGGALTREVGSPIIVSEQAVSAEASDAAPDQGPSWLPTLLRDVDLAERQPLLWLCVTTPKVKADAETPDAGPMDKAVRDAIARVPPERRSVSIGAHWSTRVALARCELPDAGVATATGVAGGLDAGQVP